LLRVQNDYFVPLMLVLDALPERSGKTKDVINLFWRIYSDKIESSQLERINNGRFRWENNLRWSREKLKQLEFLDASQAGIWHLTDIGHKWLLQHPDTSHLGVVKKYHVKNKKTQLKRGDWMTTDFSSNDFFTNLETSLTPVLMSIIVGAKFRFVRRRNAIQIRVENFPGCHYELFPRPGNKFFIALHFESTRERSQTRLRLFEPSIESIKESLKMPVFSGDFEYRGWTQVRIEMKVNRYSMDLIPEIVDLSKKFIGITVPILHQVYASEKSLKLSNGEKRISTTDEEKYQILISQVSIIHEYLLGRSGLLPTAEKLCDWISFCYIFGMYDEAVNLFSYVNQEEVNDWYYDRIKKVVKACEQKKGCRS